MDQNDKRIPPEWRRLFELGLKINYGEVRVIFQNGKPVRVEKIVKQIKLDDDDEYRKGLEVTQL